MSGLMEQAEDGAGPSNCEVLSPACWAYARVGGMCRSPRRSVAIAISERRHQLAGTSCKVAAQFIAVLAVAAAAFCLGHTQGTRQTQSEALASITQSKGPTVADVENPVLEFSVPGEPGEDVLLRGGNISISDDFTNEAPPRRLRLKINMPVPVRIRPPGEWLGNSRDKRLMEGCLSMDYEAVRTKYARWFLQDGCFKLSPSDKARKDEKVTFLDESCMHAESYSLTDRCASGLPFYRKIMQDGETSHDCMSFCMSKGLDQFGIIDLPGLVKERTMIDSSWECRCGATSRNKAVWGDKVDRRLQVMREDRVEEENSECKLVVWRYIGPMPDGAVPYQLLGLNVADEVYIDSIAKQQSCQHYLEDEPLPLSELRPRLELSEDGKVLRRYEASGRRLRSEGASPRRLGLCQDSSDTGITIGGRPASCSELTRYCRDTSNIGISVRGSCPQSCGVCNSNDWLPCYPYQCAGGAPWLTQASNGLYYIPFYFDGNVDEARRNAFRMAAMEFQQKTCIRFSEQSGGTPRLRVRIRDVNSCDASVGYPGPDGEGEVNMGWCDSMTHVGSLIHELGHVIGMNHEQNRLDGASSFVGPDRVRRGPHLTVFWQNIGQQWWAQYEPREASYVGSNDQPDSGENTDTFSGYANYDYESIMHYGRASPTGGGTAYSTVNPIYNDVVGQRSTLSFGDLRQIADMYQCEMGLGDNGATPMPTPSPTPSPPTPPLTVSPTPAPPGGVCVDRDPIHWTCNGQPCSCSVLQSYCSNSIYSADLRIYCQRTCGVCACGDTPPAGWTCNGIPCTCNALSGFCRDPTYGPTVFNSCKATCGNC